MVMMIRLVFGLVLVLISTCISGCSEKPKTIKIGLIAELTGDMPAVGASSANAAKMAVTEINKMGGITLNGKSYPLELIVADNNAQGDESAMAAQKLISQDQVLAIIGPNASSGAVPASAIAESAKTPLITPWSTNPRTTLDARTGNPKKYVFRACYTDSFEGRVLARFVRDNLKLSRVAVLYDVASEAPKSQAELFRKIFEEHGGQIVAFETYSTGDRDFFAQLTKIKATNPELIFLPAYYNDVPLVVKQAKRLELNAPFLGSDAWSSPELVNLADGMVEGFYFANHYAADAATETAQRFIENYTSLYGKAPDDVAALTYDAVGLLHQALTQTAKFDREDIRDAIAKTSNFNGVTGTMRFEPNSGDPIKSAVILQIRNGKFTWVTNVEP